MFIGPEGYYPPMVSGPAYIMTRSTAKCLHAAAMRIPYLHMEDVFITGMAAQLCGIPRCHIEGFEPMRIYSPERQFDFGADYIFHYLWPQDIIDIFQRYNQ